MPNVMGRPSTRSTPLICCSRAASHPFADRRRTPFLVSPAQESDDCTSATERALPWPPAAGISARRHGIVHDCDASSGGVADVFREVSLGVFGRAGAVRGVD